MYKLTDSTSIIRLADSATIPNDSANRDYADYLEWIAGGGVPEAADLPTPEQVKEQARQALQRTRDTSLQAIVHDFLDGRIVQVRPQDLSNFKLAIANNVAREWVMADNSVAMLAVAEMQAARDSGIAQGEVIWDNYIAELKLL